MSMTPYSAFESIAGDETSGLLLVADHAMNRLPEHYGSLGLAPEAFERHIAYDIGVEELTRKLCARLNAPAVMSTFSRLLIDPNRGEDDPTLIMRISDGAIIPGNHPITPMEWNKRIELYHRPYHQAVADAIARVEAQAGKPPLVISLHSFTPFWKSAPRPWHAAVLWDADPRAPQQMIDALRKIEHAVVGDNEPYDGALKGDTMNRHCAARGLAHALLEIRQDEIGTASGVELWADRLAPIFKTMNADPDLHVVRFYPSRTGSF